MSARRSVCVVDTGGPRNRFASQSHGFFALTAASPSESRTNSLGCQDYATASADRSNATMIAALSQRRPLRCIGVIYSPATERQSHYFESPGRQYDAIIHMDPTTAVELVVSAAP